MNKLSPNCKITRQNIANHLGIDVKHIEQMGSKQLFVVWIGLHKTLYSYYTKVGEQVIRDEGFVWLLTTKNYTPTTNRQLTQFAYMMGREGYKIEYTDTI